MPMTAMMRPQRMAHIIDRSGRRWMRNRMTRMTLLIQIAETSPAIV